MKITENKQPIVKIYNFKTNTMTRIYILLIITLTISLSCKAQFIVPIEEQQTFLEGINNSDDDNAQIPENTYYKDVNNLLDPYVGTWIGYIGIMTIEVEIEKVTVTRSSGTMKDFLLLRHRVYNELTELANTLSLPEDAPEVMEGIYFDQSGNYLLNYIYNLDCGQHGTVYIKLRNNPNEMTFFLVPGSGYKIDLDCIDSEQILPTSGTVLIKQ